MTNECYEAKTTIECEECGTKWFADTINRENSADTCECNNLKVGILSMTPPTTPPDGYFITIKYASSYPKIYEVKEKISDERLLLVDRNKERRKPRIGFSDYNEE